MKVRTALVAVLLLVTACLGGCSDEEPASTGSVAGERPNVLIFVIDTLRADRLGCYGHSVETSPNLDRFAEEGILFERAFAPSPYTATSHASLFSSIYPATHGIWNRLELESGHTVFPSLSVNAKTLAEVLLESGYQTAAVAGGGFVNERRGLAQGFELFDSKTLGAVNRIERALAWLEEERDPDKPFFLFLHTYEVHYPYLPDEQTIERFAPGYQGPIREAVGKARDLLASGSVKDPIGDIQNEFFKPLFKGDLTPEQIDFVHDLYDAEIWITDREFARVLAWLDEAGIRDDTIVLITSDHGEELWEHGYFGHHRVWEETMHIPLLVQLPDGPRGVRRGDSIDLVDLMPSLLAELGIEAPDTVQGATVDLRKAPATVQPRNHVGQANWPLARVAWRIGEQKAMFFPDEGIDPQVFHLDEDPREQEDRAGAPGGRELIRQAQDWLRAFQDRSDAHRERFRLHPKIHALSNFTPEMIRELEVLGYVSSEDEEKETGGEEN